MRGLAILTMSGIMTVLAVAQQPPPVVGPVVRYSVQQNLQTFPQDTPQKALSSTIRALELGRYEYVIAHLIDPTFVDSRVALRSQETQGDADQALRTLRARQKADPLAFRPEERLADEPSLFNKSVKTDANLRAFRLMGQASKELYENDYTIVKDLKRFLREGTPLIQGDAAKFTLKTEKLRAVFLKQINGTWYVEDRQEELPAK